MKQLLLSIPAASTAFAADGVRIEHDIARLGADRLEKVDLHLPANPGPGQRLPAVGIIDGGGWSGGDMRAAR